MKYTYSIEGLTCGGCVSDVNSKLSKHPSIIIENINLENKTITLESDKLLPLPELQSLLPKKYTITELKNNTKTEKIITEDKSSKIKQLKPLFIILFYITIASVLLNYKVWDWSNFMLDFMGLFFIVFSFFKILDTNGFAKSFKMYDPLANKFSFYAKIYPFLEIGLGLLFLLRYNIEFALVMTVILLTITTIGVTKTLLNKNKIQCACLGTALNLPMTEATFIENAIMILMAIVMLTNLLF